MKISEKCPKEIGALPHHDQQIIKAIHKSETFGEMADFLTSPEFGMKLFEWCSLLGIRTTPDQATIHYLVDFFENVARNMTIAEMELVLKMNMTGELWEPVEHFQSLTFNYFSKVVHAYNKFRIAAEKKLDAIKSAANKPVPVVPTKLETFMAKVRITYDYALAWAYEKPVPSYTLMFEFLKQIGLIETSDATMLSAKRAALENMKINRSKTTDRQALKRIDEVMASVVETEKITLREAQKLIVIEHYRFYGQRAYDGQGKYIEILQQAAERYVKAHPAEFLETS